MTEADRKRLIAILGMLGSNAVGERDNAARLAEEFRRKHGLSWADLLAATPSAPQPAPPPPPPKPPERAQAAPPPPKPWEPRQPAGSPLRLWLRDKQWVPLAWAIGECSDLPRDSSVSGASTRASQSRSRRRRSGERG
jgi:hypothetical protein